MLLLVFIKTLWIVDANSSINAHSYYPLYSDFQKAYKGSSLATILAASCCWKLSHEVVGIVCTQFSSFLEFMFSSGSRQKLCFCSAGSKGSLLLVLVLYCPLSELSPEIKFSLFYTQPSVSTHILQVGKDWCVVQNQRLSDFWVRYSVRAQAFMAPRTNLSPSP